MLELKELLSSRGYSPRMIDAALDRAKAIPRDIALRKVVNNKATNRPVFAMTYDPRLPSIQNIQAKHWRSMTAQDPYLASVFPQPPLTAYRRQRNIRNYIIRAKVPVISKRNTRRNFNGMKKCGKNCTACPYIKEGNTIKNNSFEYKINKQANCNTYNIIYVIQCKKDNCRLSYVGQSGRSLKARLGDHRGYIVNNVTSQATGAHFNSPGHSLSDLTVTIAE
jgi:hypothetical protein